MKVLRRYIAFNIFLTVLLVLLVIVALNSLAIIIEQVGDIREQYDFIQVLKYVAWRTPGNLASNVGFASLIGCLIGLGVLANNNELTVMRASGVSLLQIIWMVMRPVLVVITLGMILAELAPYTERIAEGSRDQALSTTQKQTADEIKNRERSERTVEKKLEKKLKEKIKKGASRLRRSSETQREKSLWNREENEFVRFATVLPSGKVYGITRFGFNEDKTLGWMQYSTEGTYQHEGWLLERVNTTYFEKTIREDNQESVYWNTHITPEMLTFVSTNPENLTFQELGSYGEFLKGQQRDSRPYQLEWWKKIIKPLEIFSLVLMAVSFIFGPLRQVTVGQRVFIGVMVGVVFQTLQNMFATSSLVFGFSPLVAVTLPIAVCVFIGCAMLTRVR